MKVLIATDSFKDCISAKEIGEILSKGMTSICVDMQIRNIPMGDGGEGTVSALVEATQGEYLRCIVNDPLFRKVEAVYGVLGDSKTVVIEMASASGIELLTQKERNPYNTTTLGTGELIKDALDRGYRRIICCIGGSATNDGGVGMASALGYRFLKSDGTEIKPVGGELNLIDKIDNSNIDIRLKDTSFVIACDVSNPLIGSKGASEVYGPQKGADADMVKELDMGLRHYANKVKQYLDKDIVQLPGAGAAGGLGAGFVAFANGKLKKGIEIVIEESGLNDHVEWADVIITGEGKIDSQTQFGKAPQGVAATAKKFGKPVIAIAGILGDGYLELYNSGFDIILSIIDKPMTLKQALLDAPRLIEQTGIQISRLLSINIEKK